TTINNAADITTESASCEVICNGKTVRIFPNQEKARAAAPQPAYAARRNSVVPRFLRALDSDILNGLGQFVYRDYVPARRQLQGLGSRPGPFRCSTDRAG